MNDAFWILAVAVAALGLFALLAPRSSEARDGKKRRKNYGRVISKARRPVVLLNASIPRG